MDNKLDAMIYSAGVEGGSLSVGIFKEQQNLFPSGAKDLHPRLVVFVSLEPEPSMRR